MQLLLKKLVLNGVFVNLICQAWQKRYYVISSLALYTQDVHRFLLINSSWHILNVFSFVFYSTVVMVCFYAGFNFTPNSSTRLAAKRAFLLKRKKSGTVQPFSLCSVWCSSCLWFSFWNTVISLAHHPSNKKLINNTVKPETI